MQKVTLIPRGQARGLTWFTPDEDPSLISKQQIMARIVGALGGRAAEQIIFGTPEVTTGASSDLQQVCKGLLGPRKPLCNTRNPLLLDCGIVCRWTFQQWLLPGNGMLSSDPLQHSPTRA